ncbi:MAG: DUF4118 domain-containing protein, partial [Chloroflexi bacterium]
MRDRSPAGAIQPTRASSFSCGHTTARARFSLAHPASARASQRLSGDQRFLKKCDDARVNVSNWRASARRSWLMGYAAALAAVTLVSLFIGFVVGRINLANASMLYLFAVLATAVIFGRGPAVFAAIAAFLTFDWFFVQPLHQFTVSDPEEWISLLLFMLTATITGQLAAGQRERRREAEEREREAVVLYDVVRLMSESRLEDA